MSASVAYAGTILPAGIRSRRVAGVNGLAMHLLEAGFEPRRRPCLLLLHGFPELAYSWRKVMLPLARAGYQRIGDPTVSRVAGGTDRRSNRITRRGRAQAVVSGSAH